MIGIAIIAAAGKGERAGVDKVWARLEGKTVLERATAPFFSAQTTDEVIVVVRRERLEEARALFEGSIKPVTVVAGGESRTESVRNALSEAAKIAAGREAVVAVHDGARPFVSRELVERAMLLAMEKGSAVPVLPCADTLRIRTEEGTKPLDRESVVRVQTPQCFSLSALCRAYESGLEATDDATLYEKCFGSVTLTEGEAKNDKITYLSDLYEKGAARVGVGYDVHPLVKGRPLVLGGVTIPHDKGLLGHSDADAVTHAIMDALLTAAGLPDIGHYFPPNDPAYEGADSLKLLEKVVSLIKERGYRTRNVSATVMAQKPKLAPYLPQMEERIAAAIGIAPSQVTFAATTTEKLGIVGEERGIAAEAVALLEEQTV